MKTAVIRIPIVIKGSPGIFGHQGVCRQAQLHLINFFLCRPPVLGRHRPRGHRPGQAVTVIWPTAAVIDPNFFVINRPPAGRPLCCSLHQKSYRRTHFFRRGDKPTWRVSRSQHSSLFVDKNRNFEWFVCIHSHMSRLAVREGVEN